MFAPWVTGLEIKQILFQSAIFVCIPLKLMRQQSEIVCSVYDFHGCFHKLSTVQQRSFLSKEFKTKSILHLVQKKKKMKKKMLNLDN